MAALTAFISHRALGQLCSCYRPPCAPPMPSATVRAQFGGPATPLSASERAMCTQYIAAGARLQLGLCSPAGRPAVGRRHVAGGREAQLHACCNDAHRQLEQRLEHAAWARGEGVPGQPAEGRGREGVGGGGRVATASAPTAAAAGEVPCDNTVADVGTPYDENAAWRKARQEPRRREEPARATATSRGARSQRCRSLGRWGAGAEHSAHCLFTRSCCWWQQLLVLAALQLHAAALRGHAGGSAAASTSDLPKRGL
jgi:hypothetical protein